MLQYEKEEIKMGETVMPSYECLEGACFFVEGLPIPKGSVRAFHNADKAWVVPQGGRNLSRWESAVHHEARKHISIPEANKGAVYVNLYFFLPQAKSNNLEMPTYKKNDLDKLTRAVLDGLTGAAFVDDGQVASIWAHKDWSHANYLNEFKPGVRIYVGRLIKHSEQKETEKTIIPQDDKGSNGMAQNG